MAHNTPTRRRSTATQAERQLFGAVAARVAAIPDTPLRLPGLRANSLPEAFMVADPGLASLHKQAADARAQLGQLQAMLASDDPMIEVLRQQLATLEQAYAQRLALLRQRAEESGDSAAARTPDIYKELHTKMPLQQHPVSHEKFTRKDQALWLWAMALPGLFQTQAAPRPL